MELRRAKLSTSRLTLSILTATMLSVVLSGCQKPESTGASDPAGQADEAARADNADFASDSVPTQTKTQADDGDRVEQLAEKLESVAKVRRDGGGDVIEVDFRGSDDVSLVAELPTLGKLRSVLLADTDVGDGDLQVIAQIRSLENLDLRGCAISDSAIAHLTQLERLKALKLSGKNGKTSVGDPAMKSLAQITSLKVLALDFLPVSDSGLKSLAPLTQLVELYLAGTDLTSDARETLSGFASLKKLRLASTKIDGATISSISQLTGLVDLDVSDCVSVGDSAGESLGGMTQLVKLNLYATSVGEEATRQLETLKQLTWLNLDKTKITDASLSSVGSLEKLTFLHLGSNEISDRGLDHLAKLNQLETLIVTRTQVSEAGVSALKEKLPTAEIQWIYQPQ